MNIIIVERVRQGQQLKLINKATSVRLARLRTISFRKLQLILDVFEAFQFRRLHLHSLSDGQVEVWRSPCIRPADWLLARQQWLRRLLALRFFLLLLFVVDC